MIVKTNVKIGKSLKKAQEELMQGNDSDKQESELETEDEMYSEGEAESADDELAEESDDEHQIESENDSDIQKSEVKGNPGWADAMQKILRTGKPKRKKTIVLSKAKKLCDVVKKEKEEEVPFELVGENGEVKKEKIKKEYDATDKLEIPHKRRKDNLGIRVKPSVTDRERERTLQKIATKGVVQLFNAVKQQQTEISKKLSEAGPLERKREQVLKSIDKRAFLDVLMGESKSIPVDNEVKDESEKEKAHNEKKDDKVWSVLRDDFVMGAKLKDWDRKDDNEDSSAPEEMDTDD